MPSTVNWSITLKYIFLGVYNKKYPTYNVQFWDSYETNIAVFKITYDKFTSLPWLHVGGITIILSTRTVLLAC